MREGGDWASRLGDRNGLDRASTAERVADVLRDHLSGGVFPPGTRLVEETMCAALGVSRNTLREAFRLLSHEGLIRHELNRGVFVTTLEADDVQDLFRLRRVLELAAVGAARTATADALEDVGVALARAEAAAARGDWHQVSTENLHFHQALVGLAGSRRMSDLTRRLLAELRLAFHIMAEPQRFHSPYLADNRRLYELLRVGEIECAVQILARYLDDAERELLEVLGTPAV